MLEIVPWMALAIVPWSTRGAQERPAPEAQASGATEVAASSAAPAVSGAPEVASAAPGRHAEGFAVADYDANGWLSYREARESLGLDRLTFAGFDANSDGRVDREEFEARMTLLQQGDGAPPQAKPGEGPVLLPARNSEQLRNAFDATSDGALEAFEIDQLLDTYRRTDVPTKIVLEKLDADQSGKLELGELAALSQLLSATYTSADAAEPAPTAASLDELFGGLVERSIANYEGTAHPPQVLGPVRPFRRLDLDTDGFVRLAELERLQRPQTLTVRAAAVLAALDENGDGGLDTAEFARALGD